jgi:hypothetical protein
MFDLHSQQSVDFAKCLLNSCGMLAATKLVA